MKTALIRSSSARAAVCWHANLDRPLPPQAAAVLSPAERERAGRMLLARDQRRFIAAHVLLRQLLGARTGQRPRSLLFSTGACGKPSITGNRRVHFSLSHSGGAGVVAIGARSPLGVDVEVLRRVPDALQLAAEHFTQNENASMRALPPAARSLAFLTCWTRKEACLKAIGYGLMLAPSCFEVGIEPSACVVDVPTPDGRLRVALAPVPVCDDLVASLAEWPAPDAPGPLMDRLLEVAA